MVETPEIASSMTLSLMKILLEGSSDRQVKKVVGKGKGEREVRARAGKGRVMAEEKAEKEAKETARATATATVTVTARVLPPIASIRLLLEHRQDGQQNPSQADNVRHAVETNVRRPAAAVLMSLHANRPSLVSFNSSGSEDFSLSLYRRFH